MTNGEKYKTHEERENALAQFCASNSRGGCKKCPASIPQTENCDEVWLSLECEEETQTQDKVARIEREKRVQEVALQLVARTRANVAHAFQMAEEYIAECERREKLIKKGGALSLPSDDDVEEYIRNLRWSDEATEDEKTIVAENIRGFVAWLQNHIKKGGEE